MLFSFLNAESAEKKDLTRGIEFMPELRKDPVTGRWVIISTERGMRPLITAKYKREKRYRLSFL
jgi:hypothetical protein